MLSKLSVKKPYTVIVGVILVIVLGAVSLTKMTTDLLPDMSLPYALVITTDMGASPEKVESDVTAPVEASMATTSSIKNVSSASYDNYSMVILEYEQNANMDSVIIEIQQKLDQLEGSFPDGAGKPMIMQIDPDMMPVMVASADVEGMTQSEISDYVENELSPVLESIDGVASVSTTGTVEENIHVTLDQDKIDALNQKIQSKIEEQFTEPQEQLDQAAEQVESGRRQMESGKDQLANQLGQAENEVINGKSQAFVAESDLSQNYTVLKATDELIKRAIPELQSIYEQGMGLKADIEQAQKEAQMNSDDGSRRIEELLEEAKISGDQEQINQILAMTGENQESIAEAGKRLELLQEELLELNTSLNQQWADQLAALNVSLSSIDDIPQVITQLSQKQVEIQTAMAALQTAQEQVTDGKTTLDDAYVTLNRMEIDGILEMSEASAQLAVGEARLEQGQEKLEESKQSALESADLNQILSVETLGQILTAQNFSMPAGYVNENKKQYLVRVGDEVSSVEELENLVLVDVGMDGIAPIRLSDVAETEVVDDTGDSYSKVNGNPAIMLSIEKQTGYSTGDVTKRIKTRFESLEKENDKLHMTILMNQGVYIDTIVQSVMENMILGAILAVLILILFLKDIKPTLVIACSIPLSVVFAIVLMYFTGISLNIISLSGLALGVGMLVDNSIVVIENIYRLRNQGFSIRKAAVEGAGQVAGAIFASTLTTVCVFAPIIFTEGITRQLFVDIALTIAYTLAASLIVALTFVPMMASGALKNTREIKHPWFDRILDGYEKVLRVALRFKPIVLICVVVFLVASVTLSVSKGFTFMDMNMETEQLTVTVSAKEDEKLTFEELMERADEVVDKISGISGVDSIGAMAGGGGIMSMGSTDSVTMYVLIDDSGATGSEITASIQALTADLDCDVNTDSSASDMSSFFGSGISVRVSGKDLDKLQKLAGQIAEVVEKTEGTVDVDDGLGDTTPSFTVKVDKEKAAKYGMTTAQVYQLVYKQLASNTSSTTISTDLKDYKVYVQSGEQADVTPGDIRKLTFPYTDRISGETTDIPLKDIAEFEEGESLNVINRSSQTRYISVTAGVDEDHNVTLVSNQIQKELDKIKLPDGYEISMTGEDETIRDAMNQLYLMLILAVVFIYLIMVAQFQSFLSPFIIMFTIPLAFTGGFFALFVTDNEVGVVSMIGFVMLAGVIVNNGIVLVDYINQLRREGMDKKEAIVTAGRTRLRPILMTALTTILAMSTMAMGLGSGSEMMQPMAIVTEGGMLYGTLLTLIVVPCIYDLFTRNKSMVEEEI
ncbi:efflux RND transporter permease subunit [Roseburia intestinalis]|uniref:efflux RND transporter permease subunit n=1 Tax=Roseburia intestinalis TaxID=166486 RepID=UPI00201B6237|nr:efflux RND transporter permease subunit [Roseburia intestinalis]UQT31390.1 efflux RND transporter permease subunit [Roseburia intestinalis]